MAADTPEKDSSIWHPFTQHGLYPVMTPISHANGAYLFTEDGRRLIDAISSWWVITHGHGHFHIRAAVQTQAERLDQVVFGGFTHQPAERVANELVRITPDGLDYVFFSDSGSTAVEVALKMALGYWHNRGDKKRHRILALEHGYHGDTIGTMSIGARSLFNAPYEPLLFTVDRLPSPATGGVEETIAAFDAACAEHGGEIAALIVEPLIQGAGGMLMYPPGALSAMKEICVKHDILLIADEVMTAWGRTGTRFAFDQTDIAPDIACYAKGLTGGFLPLAVTMCHERIFEAHRSADRAKTFFHSSSFTANPLACAAAAANLEIWQNEPVRDRIAAISGCHQRRIARLAGHPGFENARHMGAVAAVDLKVKDPGYLTEIAPKLYDFFLERGVLLRPIGNVIYVMPPYSATQADLDEVYDAIEEAGERFSA